MPTGLRNASDPCQEQETLPIDMKLTLAITTNPAGQALEKKPTFVLLRPLN
jgi:hypothetical protein